MEALDQRDEGGLVPLPQAGQQRGVVRSAHERPPPYTVRPHALTIPWCTFTDPEVAHVGISGEEAARAGVTTLTVPLAGVDRAILDGETAGFARASVRVSGRRFEQRPVVDTAIVNVFPWLYRLGVPPAAQARLYRQVR